MSAAVGAAIPVSGLSAWMMLQVVKGQSRSLRTMLDIALDIPAEVPLEEAPRAPDAPQPREYRQSRADYLIVHG